MTNDRGMTTLRWPMTERAAAEARGLCQSPLAWALASRNSLIMASARTSVSSPAAKNAGEDEMQFFGFLPEFTSFVFQPRFGSGCQTNEVLGLFRLLLAGANLVDKFLFGDCFIGFAIVRTHTGATADKLID